MSDPIGPAKPVSGLSRLTRRSSAAGTDLVKVEASDDQGAERNLPVVAATPVTEQPAPSKPGLAVYAAQVMGQGGQKRGLRGGSETLDRARSTYLETEWSGPSDRRIRRGRITKTDI